jgi:hypothetical protein
MLTLTNRLRALEAVLRFAGVVTFSAFFAMVLPTDWMAAAHERLGFGEFPRAVDRGARAGDSCARHR